MSKLVSIPSGSHPAVKQNVFANSEIVHLLGSIANGASSSIADTPAHFIPVSKENGDAYPIMVHIVRLEGLLLAEHAKPGSVNPEFIRREIERLHRTTSDLMGGSSDLRITPEQATEATLRRVVGNVKAMIASEGSKNYMHDREREAALARAQDYLGIDSNRGPW